MADRKAWNYVEVTPDEQSALRRMAKAENKTKDALVQEMLAPVVTAEVNAFVAKEKEAADKLAKEQAEAKAKADAAKPAETTATTNGSAPEAPKFTGQPAAAGAKS